MRGPMDGDPRKALHWTGLISGAFCIFEFVAGWWANSLALMSDAAHNLTDLLWMALAYVMLWLGRRPPTGRLTYGFRRAEVLGALAGGLGLWLVCGMLIYSAIGRLRAPPEVMGPAVALVGALALIASLINLTILRGRGDSLVVKGVYLHIWADLLNNGGVLVAGLVLWLTGWRLIDPLISCGIVLLILYNSWDIVRETLNILMEGSPPGLDLAAVYRDLGGLTGVEQVHHLHVWTVAPGNIACSVHLVAPDRIGILEAARELLEKRYGIAHCTIQIEMSRCE
jgi:cobalt-zinc-cadmium efflux system protein